MGDMIRFNNKLSFLKSVMGMDHQYSVVKVLCFSFGSGLINSYSWKRI
jgi:hypothetical protein